MCSNSNSQVQWGWGVTWEAVVLSVSTSISTVLSDRELMLGVLGALGSVR